MFVFLFTLYLCTIPGKFSPNATFKLPNYKSYHIAIFVKKYIQAYISNMYYTVLAVCIRRTYEPVHIVHISIHIVAFSLASAALVVQWFSRASHRWSDLVQVAGSISICGSETFFLSLHFSLCSEYFTFKFPSYKSYQIYLLKRYTCTKLQISWTYVL